MVIRTFGDVHGYDDWKKGVYRYDENGEVVECLIGKEVDKVIFLGDYVDDWYQTDKVILDNLIEIVELKKKYPDNVVLLWGNHDMAYVRDERVSGFRLTMMHDIKEIFNKNYELFQLAYQYKNNIWTHAGIHRGWYEYYVQPLIEGKKETRFTPFIVLCENLADQLNLMLEFNYDPLFMISPHRGGRDKVGGPLWVDKVEIYTKPLQGYHQIVGHNPVPYVRTYTFKNDTKVTFCDCLRKYGEYYTLEVK